MKQLLLGLFMLLAHAGIASNSPDIQCPGNLTVTVADINCRASVDFPSVVVQGSCGFFSSAEAFWTDGGIGKSIAGSLEFVTDSTGTDTLAVFGTVADFPVGATSILYVVSDDCGNSTSCSFVLTVSGSTLPICSAPVDLNISCTDFDPTLASYGGLAAQSCSVDSVLVQVDWSSFDTTCIRGTLVRQFQVFDQLGNTGICAQKIVVDHKQDYFIRFPNDVIATVCNSTGIYGEPTFLGNGCELLSVSYNDQIITVVPDACVRIERDWTVVNWCTYNPALSLVYVPNPTPNAIQNHPANLPGPVVSSLQTQGDPWKSTIVRISPSDPTPTNYSIYYQSNANGYKYTQSIKIIDTRGPELQHCPNQPVAVLDSTQNDPELWNEPYWWDNDFQSNDLNEAATPLAITATDVCSGANLGITFELFLDLNNDGVMETLVESNQLGANGFGWNNVLFGNVSGPGEARQFDGRNVPATQKWGFALQRITSGNQVSAALKFNTIDDPNTFLPMQLPHGRHKIKWHVTDGCGNQTSCEYEVRVRDGIAPELVCKTDLAADISFQCYIYVNATDLILNAEDNTTPDSSLVYGIRKAGTGSGFPVDAFGNPEYYMNFGLLDLGVQNVEVWCQDNAGNASFCLTTVTVTLNGGNCDLFGSVNITGYIKTALGEGIKDVALYFTGSAPFTPPFSFYGVTDSSGYYSIQNAIPLAATVQISPAKDDQPLNGVTSYDLTLISRHILDTEPLDSPYKLIAADANKNGSITTFDIVELRKLILGIYEELPNNTSWRFVPKSYSFPNPMNPFMPPFPEHISNSLLMQNITDGDFTGVKIGDVNHTAIPAAWESPAERHTGTQIWTVACGRKTANGSETRLEAGEIVNIAFASELELAACQFTLNTYGLDVLEILPAENMQREHFAHFPEKNALTIAWEKGGKASFILKCRAAISGDLREMLSISSRITKAEAYQQLGNHKTERFDLALRFPELGTFELFQNRPNPFEEATEIVFNLPEAATARLTVFDVNGRVVYSRTENYGSGAQSVLIDKSALGANGLYYYQVEAGRYQAVRKMVKI